MQSSTTPDPGYQWESYQFIKQYIFYNQIYIYISADKLLSDKKYIDVSLWNKIYRSGN